MAYHAAVVAASTAKAHLLREGDLLQEGLDVLRQVLHLPGAQRLRPCRETQPFSWLEARTRKKPLAAAAAVPLFGTQHSTKGAVKQSGVQMEGRRRKRTAHAEVVEEADAESSPGIKLAFEALHVHQEAAATGNAASAASRNILIAMHPA